MLPGLCVLHEIRRILYEELYERRNDGTGRY